jgi:hypothetical protein
MVDSTCDFEERSRDKEARFIKNFRPLGNSPGSALAGSFDVHQELIERTEGKYGVTGIVRMTFSPARPEDREPTGSFLWQIEPARPDEPDQGACWVELINTEETRHMGFPDLRIKPWARWIFQLGHKRLIQKAAERCAHLLNGGDDSSLGVGR